MKYRFIIVFYTLILSAAPVFAGHFLSIKTIDAQTSFPVVRIQLSLQGAGSSGSNGITSDNFTVYEDGARAEAVTMKNIEGRPEVLYLVFSIDSSRSISRDFLKSIKSHARDMIRMGGSGDRIAIYRFDDSVRLLTGFIEIKKDLVEHIESIERRGTKTMLFDSIYDSIDLLQDVSSERKRIIVFTDGKDEGSSVRDDDVIELARKNSIPVFFISLKSSSYINRLARIAKLTGGKLVFSDRHEDVAGMYRTVLSVIRSSYEIEYRALSPQDGGQHRIEVRFTKNDISDRDFQNVLFYRGSSMWRQPFGMDAFFIVLIALFLILLAVIVLYFFNREKKLLARKYESEYKIDNIRARFDKAAEIDEEITRKQQPTLLERDSEYTYSSAWLVQKQGPESGKKFPIYWDEMTIGRSRENSVVIQDDSVSLKHAKIKRIAGSYFLFDLASDNGTYLNDKKLLRPRQVNDWDEIRMGRTQFIFRGANRHD